MSRTTDRPAPQRTAPPPRRTIEPWTVFVVVLTAGVVVALLLAIWQAREAVLLAFAAAVFAVILLSIARPLERWTGFGRNLTLPIAALLIIGTVALFAWIIGAELAKQFTVLSAALPDALDNLQRRLGIDLEELARATRGQQGESSVGGHLRSLPDLVGIARTAMGNIVSIGTLLLDAVAGIVVVIVGGYYLAVDPKTYRRGLVLLFPEDRHDQADAAIRDCGHALHLWLLAQLMAMAIVGTLMGLGAWMIGLPAPLAIGFFASLTEFVPIVGPLIGALPPLLLAFGMDIEQVAWTFAMVLAIQQIESNVISPLVQQRMSDIPPFLVLFGVIALGLLFGAAGVIVAAPLTIVAYVLVTKLYVRDTLGQDVPVPGRHEETPSD
jgi:predicted PurR-regulated permease PerM